MIASHLVGFEPVIGLEIHARLLTDTKIFCGCSTRFGDAPNTNVCPVCLGFPGALPVLNRRAVDFAAKAALALDCTVHEQSIFARKNYFYPDLPKGYQISQYEQPLATGGHARIHDGRGDVKRVRITRVHMEEDAGKSLHEGFRRFRSEDPSRFQPQRHAAHRDRHRARSSIGGRRGRCFRKLREILIALGVNDGNMEEGSLRCDANVSVRPAGATKLGTKTEVKNINSFRFLEKALDYEIERQIDVSSGRHHRAGDAPVGYRTGARPSRCEQGRRARLPVLSGARSSTGSAERARIDEIRGSIVELPEARRQRVMAEYALSDSK